MNAGSKQMVAGMISGTVFGLGIAVSGLSDPDNVLRFLTISPGWSPALLFTMGSAILVSFAGYKLVLHRGPVFEEQPQLPTNTEVDRKLLTGAALFGVGWGMAGFCPGPAIVGLAAGNPEPYIFVVALIAGSQLQRLVASR
ncbi:MAG: DUF6691 family protein [Woeseiaceae bacterium]